MNLPDADLQKYWDEMIVAAKRGDDEVAHSREDRLRHRALELIAQGYDCPQEIAQMVLQSSNMDFARWCA